MNMIYGSEIALKIKEDLKNKVSLLGDKRLPKLCVILVGNNPASVILC